MALVGGLFSGRFYQGTTETPKLKHRSELKDSSIVVHKWETSAVFRIRYLAFVALAAFVFLIPSLIQVPKVQDTALSLTLAPGMPRHSCNVSLVVQLHKPAYIRFTEMQLANFKRFLECNFEYHAVLAASPVLEEAAKQFVQTNGHAIGLHSCPFESLEACMDHTFRKLVPSLSHQDLVIVLNADMFLVKPWNPVTYWLTLSNPDIVAVIEDHTHLPPYLHPGTLLLNASNIPNIASISSYSPINGRGPDLYTHDFSGYT